MVNDGTVHAGSLFNTYTSIHRNVGTILSNERKRKTYEETFRGVKEVVEGPRVGTITFPEAFDASRVSGGIDDPADKLPKGFGEEDPEARRGKAEGEGIRFPGGRAAGKDEGGTTRAEWEGELESGVLLGVAIRQGEEDPPVVTGAGTEMGGGPAWSFFRSF